MGLRSPLAVLSLLRLRDVVGFGSVPGAPNLCSADTYPEGISPNVICQWWFDAGHTCSSTWSDVCSNDHPSGAQYNLNPLSSVGCSQCPLPAGSCMSYYSSFTTSCDGANVDMTRFCDGDCNAALTGMSTACDANDAIQAELKAAGDTYLSYCSGCMSYYASFATACDIAEGSTNTDMTRFCSGDCNAALTGMSTECDANDATQAQLKAAGDTYLSYCSGCMSYYASFATACDIAEGSTNTDMTRFCSGDCNAALQGMSTECDGEPTVKAVADTYMGYCPQVIEINWLAGFGSADARAKTAAVGDSMRFEWSGYHNVYQMADEAAFNNCDFSGATNLGDSSPVEITITELPAYFACSVGSHCANGQKLAVTAA